MEKGKMNAKNMYLLFLIISSILFISISSSVNAVGTCTGSCESGSQCNVYGNPNPGKVWSCKNTGSYYECIQTSADNCDYLDCSLGWRDCGCDVSGCEQRCESQYANQPGYHTRTEFCDDCGQKFTCDCYIQEVPNLFCGDGAINQYWEKCDLNGDNGRDKNNDGVFGPGECRTDCTYCGDADTQFYTEACDYKDTIYKNCATFPNDPNCCRDNSYGRNMCTYCGDGKVQTGLEECEYKSHCTAITGKILLSCNSDCVCVYEDAFGCIDGYKRDTTGIGLPLWEITTEYVNDPSIRYIAYTDSSGYYKFPQLIIGTWKVTETMKSGWAVASGYSISYNKYVSVGSTCAVANFKNKQVPTLGCVEGIKRDDNHIGLSGWTIHAKKVGQPDSSGKTAVTGSDGSY
ncbi:MAG: carboxypeptidase-like regulatory domain-containing protein, partial [Nanoarchaeota archaeon]|nr:carboxypeptidase-like regulatory domain-containing protein [Nanoarchaeota archaeon]